MFKLAVNMLLLGCLLLIVGGRILGSGANIQPDSPRYASAGLNVYQHGVLSPERYRVDHVPTPGFYAGGVFTALEIALAAFLNDETYRDLVCIAIGAVDEVCGKKLWSLKAIYSTETVIFHLCVLFVGWIFFGRNIIAAWLCLVASLAFNDTYLYASSPLSEPGYLMLGGLFMAAWAYAYDNPEKIFRWAMAGVCSGLLVLVKPAWLLLPMGLAVFPVVSVFLYKKNGRVAAKATTVFLLAFTSVLLPMFLRSVFVLDTFAMSQGSYLVSSLSHRLAFNLMSWREWGIGWIYYLPLSGAQRLFGAEALVPLGWDEGSYYEYGRDVLDRMANEGRTILEARAYLLSEYVFAMPIKFIAVTLLLLWRGIFVGHVVAMLAVPCVAAVMLFAKGDFWRRWMFIFLPVFFMASINAALSVSLYRYNLPIIVPYSLALVWVGIWLVDFLIAKFDHIGFLATARTFLPAMR